MQPSYTAVAARQTLSREPPKPQAQKTQWSPDVRAYVQRAFEQDNAIAGIDTKMMQDKLKEIITHAAETAQLGLINWATYPLPQELIQQERKNSIASLMNPTYAQMASISLTPKPTPNAFDSASKKRKSGDLEMLDPHSEENSAPPWKKQVTGNGLEDRITGKSKTQEKKQSKASVRLNGIQTNQDALEKRRQRFGQMSPKHSETSRGQSPVTLTGPVVGTCQRLEKNYFRLTDAPPPDTVRPLQVLEEALDLVQSKWEQHHNYTYACDQMKSLRQDLTVQRIKTSFTVKVYEAHARMALQMGDLGEYNQCQTQLRALYKVKLGGNPEEFLMYRMLYIIYTRNRTDMNDLLADLTVADKRKPAVHYALQVRAALSSGNYHKFFKLYQQAPYLGACLLDKFVLRERIAALATICKAYKPNTSLKFIVQTLAFGNTSLAEDPCTEEQVAECLKFLSDTGGAHLVIQKADGTLAFDAGKAGPLYDIARGKTGGVDIKGQL